MIFRYRDFYGCSATISVRPDKTARLIIYDSHGWMIVNKEYYSLRGARIAMGRYSDSWYSRRDVV